MPEPSNGTVQHANYSRLKEIVSAAAYFSRSMAGAQALQREMDDAERAYGETLYAAMMNDPAVGASVDMVRQRAVAMPELDPPEEFMTPPGETPTPEQALADEICKFCARAIHNPRRALIESMNEWTYGLVEDKLAEIVLEQVVEGPDAGRLTFGAFKFKPRESWQWVVDGCGNVVAIAGYVPMGEPAPRDPKMISGISGDAVVLDPDRFAVFCWGARDSDPRTKTILRRAYNAWNMKIRTWPEKLKGDSQFGTPSVAAIMPQDIDDPEEDAYTGVTLPDGSEITTAEAAILYQLIQISNGTAGVLPYGTELKIVESARSGSTLDTSINLYNREIQTAILQTPATVQAEQGKAQSQQDLVPEHLVRLVRAMLCGLLRNMLRSLVRLNFGADAAARMTPVVTIEEVSADNQSEMIGAWSQWVIAAGATENQLAAICDKLGLPPKKAGDKMAVDPKSQDKGTDNAAKGTGESQA